MKIEYLEEMIEGSDFFFPKGDKSVRVRVCVHACACVRVNVSLCYLPYEAAIWEC